MHFEVIFAYKIAPLINISIKAILLYALILRTIKVLHVLNLKAIIQKIMILYSVNWLCWKDFFVTESIRQMNC